MLKCLARIFTKPKFYKEGPKRRFRSLTNIWSSKESLSIGDLIIWLNVKLLKRKTIPSVHSTALPKK